MTKRLQLAVLVAVVFVVTGAAADEIAETDETIERTSAQALSEAKAYFDGLDYRGALAAARAVDTDPEATSQQRVEALEIAGLSYLILGEDAAARAAFEELLDIDPYYQLREETGSPKIREFFAGVKARARDTSFAELVHAAPTAARSGAIAELEVSTGRGASEIVEVVVRWRGRGAVAYQSAMFRRREHDRWAAGIALPESEKRWVLEYYVEARDLAGRAIGQIGGPNAPLAIPVEAGGVLSISRTPWYRRWYVIGAAGAAAVGAGVAVGIAAGDRTSSGSLEPGTITLTP